MGSKFKKNKKDEDTNMVSFKSTRVLLTEKGELMIALPIYVNELASFFDNSSKLDTFKVNQMITLGFGLYDHVGFIVYHPEVGELVMKKTITNIFEDLGEL